MTLRFRRCALGASLVIIAGCGGPQSIPGAATAGATSRALPQAEGDALLYLSDAGGSSGPGTEVFVYSYPKIKTVETLTGFQGPAGICPDSHGNVWIVNSKGGTIVEYAHGGTSPIATLSVPKISPQSCAVDPVTGNLAVVGYPPLGRKVPGKILVYPAASGTPKLYRVPFEVTSFCGYDAKGNLFVDGFGYNETPSFAFVEIPKSGTKFKRIDLHHAVEYPGPVQWDGKHIAVGDDNSRVIYRFDIQGKSGVLKGSTTFDGMNYLSAAWIQGSKVIATSRGGSSPAASSYEYPAGGNQIKTITNIAQASGVTVSVAR